MRFEELGAPGSHPVRRDAAGSAKALRPLHDAGNADPKRRGNRSHRIARHDTSDNTLTPPSSQHVESDKIRFENPNAIQSNLILL